MAMPPRTFLVVRLANGWGIRLYRVNHLTDMPAGQIPLNDIWIAKTLKEVANVIERMCPDMPADLTLPFYVDEA